ncbi:uncharacterized protein TRUGW13939_07219 [Talaromyces rugulosus]|uniref:NAD-dependent epimerase/dehydratase domain-containing protein n=1 Tax=Talaromyces rugulosus TaxID=121627 RepID=A0A7H8R1K1_TALRU|nr:uncharacterized protein TRUGW13939_07219 [Talaromyces rugulosus]QKX60077.1 hypothetical protein TRUGW13939_07219 [Talaromyces rugulosus]
MPALSGPPFLILVTGANGFVGTWIVHHLLENGYSVRAAVRTKEKGQYLLETFKSYGTKLQLTIVGNMTEEGVFNGAVQGVDGIIHTASPVGTVADDPNELIEPAVKGVTGILLSALQYGSGIQRIVFTSSCAAILDTSDKEVTVSEKDWNDQRVEECERLGRDASGLSKYSASKTLAERAVWDFYLKHREEIMWDLVAINPPYIFGPIIHDVTSPDILNSSSKRWYDALVHNDFRGLSPATHPGHGWVDVRDVAEAHIKALTTPGAGGERIIVSAGSWVWQDMINAASTLPGSIYKRHPDARFQGGQSRAITFNTEKADLILGLKFRSMKELAYDILLDFTKRGWYP